jgi:hypothetical protein
MAVPRTTELESYMAFIPTTLHDNVIELTSVKIDRSTSDQSITLMLGFICETYSSKSWTIDVAKWLQEFPNTAVFELQLLTETNDPTVLHEAKAIEAINEALERIHSIPDNTPLRMVVLGPGFHPFLFDTIKHLLKEWRTPDGEKRRVKQLNFIISNPKNDQEYFNFCKKLCLSGVCQSIQFYNTGYYNPFGHYNESCA